MKYDYSLSGTKSTIPVEEMVGIGDTDEAIVDVNSFNVIAQKKKAIDASEFISPSNTSTEQEWLELSSEFFGTKLYIDLDRALSLMCGYTSFKSGQKEVIAKLMSRESVFLVLGTGSGKSLCYQLFAFILLHASVTLNATKPLSIVVLPTISLMADQLKNVPSTLHGLCWNANSNYSDTIKQLESSTVDLLFVSPEKFSSNSFQQLMQSRSISFVCVDEAHCVDEWSHAFRSSYLSLGQTLKDMGVPQVLACTGTATIDARLRISDMLNIPQDNILSYSGIRENLMLSVTVTKDNQSREKALLELMNRPQYKLFSSVIIYTMFQNQADKLASSLRIHNIHAESYHAGKDPVERSVIQSRFMNSRLKVIVATISFGLGLNKSNVNAIIHCGLPRSIEEYVQEIGRCARDGSEGHCHLLLCPEDYMKLSSLSYADGVDALMIAKFVNALYESSGITVENEPDHKYVCLPYTTLETVYDMKSSWIDSFLFYLGEAAGKDVLDIQASLQSTYTIHFTKTSLETLAETHPVVKAVLECGTPGRGRFCFVVNAFDVWSKHNIAPVEFEKLLFGLKKQREVQYEARDRSIHVRMKKNIEWEVVEGWIEQLSKKMGQLELAKIIKLDQMYSLFREFASDTIDSSAPIPELHGRIESYFDNTAALTDHKLKFYDPKLEEQSNIHKNAAIIEVKCFVIEHQEMITSGRAVARIFHGLSSPAYPYQRWADCRQWGQYKHVYFRDLMMIAQRQMLHQTTKSC